MLIIELIFSLDSECTNKIILPMPDKQCTVFVSFYFST